MLQLSGNEDNEIDRLTRSVIGEPAKIGHPFIETCLLDYQFQRFWKGLFVVKVLRRKHARRVQD